MLHRKKKSLWENEVRGVNGCMCGIVYLCVGKFISFFSSPSSFSPLHSYRPSNCHFRPPFAVLDACLPKPGSRGRYSSHCPLLPSLGPQMTSTQIFLTLRMWLLGLPSGSVVKNLPVNVGDGIDPWSRKISHAVKQLSTWTTTTEPVLQSPGTAATEAHVPSSSCFATREATKWRVAPTCRN